MKNYCVTYVQVCNVLKRGSAQCINVNITMMLIYKYMACMG